MSTTNRAARSNMACIGGALSGCAKRGELSGKEGNVNAEGTRNQSGELWFHHHLSFGCPRYLPGEPTTIRAVTANVSIPSVGDLSGRRILIEDIYPLVDGGRFAVKRIVGEAVDVWADIFREGHAILASELLWRLEAADRWSRVPMRLESNDRWTGTFTPDKVGRHVYAIEAWTDVFATWRRDFLVKRDAGLDLSVEREEGRKLLASLK